MSGAVGPKDDLRREAIDAATSLQGNPALVAAGLSIRMGIEPDWLKVAAMADYCEEPVVFDQASPPSK